MTDNLQPGTHLSPDQLSAFAENALPEHERLSALTHLSACADCRQTVFLAQQADPAFIAAPAAAAETPRRTWFSLPQLFGAAAAALACTLILALVIHYGLQQTSATAPVTTAKVEPPPQPAAIPPAAVAALTPPQPSKPALIQEPKRTPQSTAPATTPVPSPVILASPSYAYSGASMPSSSYADKARQQDGAPLEASADTYAALPPTQPAGLTRGMPSPQPMTQPSERRFAASSVAKSEKDSSARTTTAAAAAPPAAAPPLPRAPSETVEVASDALTLDTLQRSTGAAIIGAAAKSTGNPAVLLPSKLAAVSVLHSAGRTLALDSAGALFVSRDFGSHWTAVKPQWSGKVTQIALAPTPTRLYLQQPSQNQTQAQVQSQSNNSSLANNAGGLPQQQAPIPAAGFELTTATGVVWHSFDGITWHAR